MQLQKHTSKAPIVPHSGKLRRFVKYRYLYFMLAPFLLWYLLFSIRPLYWLQIAFKDFGLYKGVADSPWVGLTHFKEFFTSPFFIRVLRNSLVLNIYQLLFCFTASIVLALMLNEVKSMRFKKTVQVITYLPYFISVVVVAGIVTTMLSPTTGVINVLRSMLGGEKIYFLTQAKYFRGIYTIMMLWIGTGYGTVVYLAALAGIDQQLYEASAIDGANKLQQLLHITLPGILPTIVVMLVMRIGSMLSVGYESIILLYQPSTYETADVISTYAYRLGFSGTPKYDLSTAVDIFNSVVALILVAGANTISRKLTQTALW